MRSVREHAGSGGVHSWDSATMMRVPSTYMHTSVSGHSRGCGGPALDFVAHRHAGCSSNAEKHGRSRHAYRAAVSALTHAGLRAARAEACAPKPRRLMALTLPGLSERQPQHVAPQAVPARTTSNRILNAGGNRGCSIQANYVSNGKTHQLDPSESSERHPSAAAGAFPIASTSGREVVAGPSCDSGTPEFWQELLTGSDVDLVGTRARSASDAAVLRRKGHLKEQDRLIEFLLHMHNTHTSMEAMQKMERWIEEHRQDPQRSRLARMVPSIGTFYTPLRLVEAFLIYDDFFALSRRRYVPPNFAEMRHVLNIAQVHASAKRLQFMTFDADGTLYEDGHHMQHDSQMIRHILVLMRSGVHVAIVTAAGYPGSTADFEARIEGLLAAFRRLRLPPDVLARFHLMGGECNYLLALKGPEARLAFVPDTRWKSPEMLSWKESDIAQLLATAEGALLDAATHLRLPVKVIRKERAVGVVPLAPTVYEVLEELAISVQTRLCCAPLPFCAFNGGGDVFVDIGNKSLGLAALMAHLGVSAPTVLHVGDRFTVSGNDSAVRACCPILWVANPEETSFFVNMLLEDLRARQAMPYIE